jgi:hypothetical protein
MSIECSNPLPLDSEKGDELLGRLFQSRPLQMVHEPAMMPTEPTSSNPISKVALNDYSREELRQTSEPSLLKFGHLIEKRMKQEGAPPALEALQGIHQLVTDRSCHPALGAKSPASRTSPTTNAEASGSRPTTDAQ